MSQTTERDQAFAEGELRSAVAVGNVPTLLMVLFQLTGDSAWLEEPYLPTRTRGLDLHDSGGLDEGAQARVRAAAADALLAWSSGRPAAVPDPDLALLRRMMSVCMGEDVAVDFPPMLAEDMGFAREPRRTPTTRNPNQLSAVIVGCGVSGLLASVKLSQAGIPHTILEKNDNLGGTWLNNRYPGCGVDTPSYLYTLSFFPNNWSTYFARRDDIWKYFLDAARAHDVQRHVEFGVEVLSAQYQGDAQGWLVTARDRHGKTTEYRAAVVISAVGLLNVPFTPEIDGADEFKGTIVHSAEWPEDLDIDSKRVAVIGAGASAMQIVPATVDKVAEMTIYQRTPQWIAPAATYYDAVPDGVHWLMDKAPFYRAWYRFRLAWTFNDKTHPSLQVDPEWPHPERSLNAINEGHRTYFLRYLQDQLDGRPDLIEKSTPTYPPFGKRMLMDNGWFKALCRPHVTLVTDGIALITPTGIKTDTGEERPADVIVLATGFAARNMIGQFDVHGISGRTLRDAWGDEDAYAYLGVTVPGFPNFFIMYGPQTNGGHGGSYLQTGECQIRYIVDVLCSMIERDIATVDCRKDVCDEYNRRVDEAHDKMIWTHRGMETAYRNANGRVVVNSPWRLVDYWRMTHEANLDDYFCEPRPGTTLRATGNEDGSQVSTVGVVSTGNRVSA